MARGRMLERRSVESDWGCQPGRLEYGFESFSILERKPIAAVREWGVPQKDIYLLSRRGWAR